MLAHIDCSQDWQRRDRSAETSDYRAFARHRQSSRRTLRIKTIKQSGGWSEDVSDPEVIDSIRLLAATEGIFTETAGGVTVATAGKLYRQDRILPEETTVLCITGNGLKTTDALTGVYQTEKAIAPKLAEFENYLRQTLDVAEVAKEDAATVSA